MLLVPDARYRSPTGSPGALQLSGSLAAQLAAVSGSVSVGTQQNPWLPTKSGHDYSIGLLHDINEVSNYETWLGKESDAFAAFVNSDYWDTWTNLRGGAGSDPNVWQGQIGSNSYQFWTSRTSWPTAKPWILSSLAIVPTSDRNKWNGSAWTNPGIWATINSGAHDGDYRMLFRRLATMIAADGRDPGKVAINLGHEMTGSWFPWSIGTDVAGYIQAWRRIVDIARTEFANYGAKKQPIIVWRPSPVRRFGSTWNTLHLWDAYPGDDWVDAVGISVHDKTGIASTADWNAYLTTGTAPQQQEGFKTFFDWFVANSAANKWFCFPEWSFNKVSHGYFPKTTNPQAAFRGMYDLLANYGSRVLFCVYMHSNSNVELVPGSTWSEPYRQIWGAP